MKNIIYGLRDPRNDVYQYIGKSTVGIKRPLKHLTRSHNDNVNKFVKELEDLWLYPIIDIIEEVKDINDLIDREKYWIEYYLNINPNLLNIQNKTETTTDLSYEEKKYFDMLCEAIVELPKILKQERLSRNITQSDIAKIINRNRSTIVSAESSHNVNLLTIVEYIMALKNIDMTIKKLPKKRHKRAAKNSNG